MNSHTHTHTHAYTCTIIIMYIYIYTEVPFESGKVIDIWYVGNTVYTVGPNLELSVVIIHACTRKSVMWFKMINPSCTFMYNMYSINTGSITYI